ncbi:uncharacterized protein BO97DRAFT_400410 [Aspergillus homomorphus CBS 101889]|uniref:Apple domain-containing protein n=1 Tax=Aspergillus homomorphus (strain CBS 101889) TaxID=1450537 RepID=A0A395HID0_ASPHC|nr:hypothetical protein BO97DRAFT_400410 [Aspergillus homomorphus CBS 101889]RAL07249.1 hypothetical protein BO97DRAFT_400410 [Aspergillus homomorphus CBS 101889]
MLLPLSLIAALLGTTVASTGATSKCLSSNTLGADNYQLCCPNGQGSGKGTVGETVFEYSCGQYYTGKSGPGTQHRQVNSAKDCAQLCSSPDCPGASWQSTRKQCWVLGSGNSDYSAFSPAKDWLIITRSAETPKDPDPEEECKDLIDAAKETAEEKIKCEAEKAELTDKAATTAGQCESDKEAALAGAQAQCATEKKQIQEEGEAQCKSEKEAASSQCENDKNQLQELVDDARSQCKSEKDAANTQCENAKNEIRQQGESKLQQSKTQCDAEKSELQQKVQELEKKAASAPNGQGHGQWQAVDPQCRDSSWTNLCGSGCSQRQFKLGGVDFQVKCGVRTNGANEEAWYYRQSILECAEACALTPRCLGVGWRSIGGEPAIGVTRPQESANHKHHTQYCHAMIRQDGFSMLRNTPLYYEHLIYAPARVTPV